MTTNRQKLSEIVSDLKNYLDSRMVRGSVGGLMPADDEKREAFEQEVQRRQEQKIAAFKENLEESESKSPAAQTSPDSDSKEGPKPWKRFGSVAETQVTDDSYGSSEKSRNKTESSDSDDEMTPADKLAYLREYMGDCKRCPLWKNRTNLVFGEGAADTDLVFVGEAPGYNEDQKGRPFVGRAGKLLDKMINAMGLEREEVYICNILKSRPPDNRDPKSEEIRECVPFLYKQLEIIQPRVISTLGRFASQVLLDKNESLGRMRGRWHTWRDISVMPTYHPAYLLRNPDGKPKAWADLQMVMEKLGLKDDEFS